MTTIGNWAYVATTKLRVAIARRKDDPRTLAHRLRHLGDAYYYAHRLAAAECHVVEALSIYRSQQRVPPLELANAIRSLAVIKHERGAHDEASLLWQEAHDLYLSTNVSAGVAESAARLALLAQHDGDHERSRACLTEARAAADATADPDTLRYVSEVARQLTH